MRGEASVCQTIALLARYEKISVANASHRVFDPISNVFLFLFFSHESINESDYRGPIDSQCHCPSGLFDTCDDNIPASSLFTAYVHVDSRGWNITQLQERKRGELSESAMAT